MKYNFLSIAAVLLIVLLLLAIGASYAQATPVAVNLPTGCHVSSITQVFVAPSGTSLAVTCDTPTTPTGTATACTEGTPSDVAGYTAHCSGSFLFHTGLSQDVRRPATAIAPYTFRLIIGNNVNDWPGGPFGTTEIFSLGLKQYLSIPFTPTPGHTITVNEAQTYTQHPISISVSTSPGRFNNAEAGNGVMCVHSGGQPSLILSSNGNTAQCKLAPNVQYWLNIIPAYYEASGWTTAYPGPQAQFGITVYQQN